MEHTILLIKQVLNRTFDIREGEFTKTLLMLVYIFLIISTILILKPVMISLFLSQFGVDQLPVAFILVAIFAGLVITLYTLFLKKYPLNKIIKKTLYLSSISFISFWLMIRLNLFLDLAIYFFYVWVAIFSVLAASQFWILANIIFNSREAKRLFGFIGAGAIGGGIFGGYLTSLLANLLDSSNLILIGVILISFCIPIIDILWQKNVVEHTAELNQKKGTKLFSDHPIKLIHRSKHLTYLATIIGISVIVAKLVEFQFGAISLHEIQDQDELTAFFGFWFSTMNILSLVIQLFVTRRVVGLFGVGASLFILPFGIMIGSLAVLFLPQLWSAIFLRVSDGSLKQSINKSSIELLTLPLPQEIKNQTKSFIDVFVDSLATGIGGFILIILNSGFDISVKYISLGTIALLILWFYFADKVRKEYLETFRIKLEETAGGLVQEIPEITNETVLGGIIKVLKQGTIKQVVNVLNMTKEIQNEKLLPVLKEMLLHDSTQIKLEALRNLYFYKTNELIEDVEKLVHHDNEDIRISALQYLFKFPSDQNFRSIEKFINHKTFEIKNAALIALSIEVRNNPILIKKFDLEKLLIKKYQNISKLHNSSQTVSEKIICTRIVGSSNLTAHYNILHKFMDDEELKVSAAAIKAAGQTQNLSFVDKIIRNTEKTGLRDISISSLVNYGETIIDLIKTYLFSKDISLEIKRNLLNVISTIGTQKSIITLIDALEKEEDVEREYVIDSLVRIKQANPHLKFDWKKVVNRIYEEIKLQLDTITILFVQTKLDSNKFNTSNDNERNQLIASRQIVTELLEQRIDSGLERIFKLLGLKYPPDDMTEIYKGIQSKKSDIRLSAMEFLENLLDINLRKAILPLIEIIIGDELSEDMLTSYNLKIPTVYECFKEIFKGNNTPLILATIDLIAKTNDPSLISLLKGLKDHPSKKIAVTANTVIGKFV